MTTKRKQVNEQSRNEATKDGELWNEHEVEILLQFWGEADLTDIAATLGRTVEACRQKHFDLSKRPERVVAEKATQETNTWSKGFTSLADMGF
jgi:hypothetical protein